MSNASPDQENGTEVEILKEGEQGVEVQRLQSFGCGLDVLFD